MKFYRTMYYRLFAAIADAVDQLEDQNYGTARLTLLAALVNAEELYLKTKVI